MSVSTTTTTTGRALVKEYLKIAGICFGGGLMGCAWKNYKDINQLSITRTDVGLCGVVALSWHITIPLLAALEIWTYLEGGVHNFSFKFSAEKKKKD